MIVYIVDFQYKKERHSNVAPEEGKSLISLLKTVVKILNIHECIFIDSPYFFVLIGALFCLFVYFEILV